MNRYINNETNVFKRYDGKRVFRTTRYPKIPIGFNDIYIVASETDYLDSLAYKYYQDTSLWWIIAGANNLRDGGFALDPAVEIRIPQNIQPILEEFRRLNEEFQSR